MRVSLFRPIHCYYCDRALWSLEEDEKPNKNPGGERNDNNCRSMLLFSKVSGEQGLTLAKRGGLGPGVHELSPYGRYI